MWAMLEDFQDHFLVQQKAGQADLALRFVLKVGDGFEAVVRNDERNDAALAQSSCTLVIGRPCVH
jgi:hypothetical protein